MNILKTPSRFTKRLISRLKEKNTGLVTYNAAHLLGHCPTVIYALKIEKDRIVPHAVSGNMAGLLGFELPEDLSYDWWLNRIHEEDRARVIAGISAATANEASRCEYRLLHKDGTVRWVDDQRRVVRDSTGKPIELVGTWSDITEARKLRDELSRDQKLLDGFFTSATAGLALIDRDLRFIQINDTLAEINGIPAEDHVGRYVSEVLPKLAPTLIPFLEKVMSTGKPLLHFELSGETPAKPGVLRHWVQSFFPMPEKNGQSEGVGAMVVEITAHKQAEEALRALNDRYLKQQEALATLTRLHVLHSGDLDAAQRQIAEVTTLTLDVERASIWRYEPGGKSIVCSELYQNTEKTHSSGIVLHAKDFPSYFAALQDADVIAAHDAHTDPRTAEFSDVYLRPLGINSMMDAPIHLQGSVAGVVCCEHTGPIRQWTPAEQTFLISIANLVSLILARVEQQKLEEQLRQAQKMEAIGQLAGGIAHDFNNILGAIMGYTAMAQTETQDAIVSEYLEQIDKGTKRAADLVTQILAFSRRQEQERKPVQLKNIILEALKLLRATVPASITIQSNLSSTPLVLADPTAIHQAVMNLCTNAWHAIGNEPGVLGIELSPLEVDIDFAKGHPELQPGPYVRLSISDSGCGMDRDTLQRIFEPFFTTKPPGQGTGLGLAAVHGIMKSHDGGIIVYSQPNQGTTLHLFFPAYDAGDSEEPLLKTPIPRGNGEHILFVDDEEPLATVGKSMLERLGYRVTTESNVLEAIETFAKQPSKFDLVITDLTMPMMDGVKFGTQLLQLRRDLPIILTTGYSGSMTTEVVRDLGFCDLLLKPNTARTIGEAVHRVLKGETRGRA